MVRLNKLSIFSLWVFIAFAATAHSQDSKKSTEADFNKPQGFSNLLKGQYDNAISDFTKAIEMDSRNANAYYYRGVAYQRKSENDRAISDFSRAIEIDPRYAEAYYNLGEIMKQQGRNKESERYFSEVKRIVEKKNRN